MDLELNDRRFLVCGASSGFGNAVAKTLLDEQASCIVTARRGDLLEKEFGERSVSRGTVEIVKGDLTRMATIDKLMEVVTRGELHGVVFNAGGPPPGTAMETDMEQWDEAYQLVMRWKIDLALRLAPLFVKQQYGRMLFIESKSIKEPIPALVLSNAYRAGVAGFAKSLAPEVVGKGVTVNVLAPGTHATPGIERVIKNRSETLNISLEEARAQIVEAIPVGRMGKADELASLAAWLLSVHSSFVTGQTISHDGGAIAGLFG